MGLMEQLDSFSYTIPFFNVTVDKDVALKYAETHAENGGPIFALVMLILFGLVMTLIWAYLILCACCCKKPGRSPRRRVSPRGSDSGVPDTPVSPSRSSAPLRRGGGPTSSSSGGGGGRGKGKRKDDYYPDEEAPPAPAPSPYGMRRTRSLEAEHRHYSFRCLYVTSALFCAALAVCVTGVFVAQSKFDGSVRNLLGDAEGLMLDAANHICTAEEGSPACKPKSAGQFVQGTEAQATDLLDSLTTLVATVDDRVFPYLNETIDELQLAKAELGSVKTYADEINANVTAIEQYRAWLLDAAGNSPAFSDKFPQGSLPNVTADELAAVDDGLTSIDDAIATATDAYAKVNDFVATDAARLSAELNPTNGTTARQLLDPLDQVKDSLFQARDAAMKYYGVTDENAERYGGLLAQKTWAVTLVFLIPLLLQVVFTLMNRAYAKCSAHLVLSMCCSYLCLLFFLLFGLLFATLATVSSTVCEYHLEAVDRIPPRNLTVNDVTIEVTPAVVKTIMTCPAVGDPGATPSTDNFISLLGAEALFNVTGQTEEAVAEIEEAQAGFDPQADVDKAIAQLDSLGNVTDFDLEVAVGNIETYKADIAAMLTDLPPDDVDRLNATQRDSLDEYYLSAATNPPFSWLRYGTNVTALNTLLTYATPPLPAGFLPVNDFETVWNFTEATVQASQAAWQAVEWDNPGSLQALVARLRVMDPYTDAVNDAEAKNLEVRANLTAVVAALGNVEASVARIEGVQSNLTAIRGEVNATLHALRDEAGALVAEVDGKEAEIRALGAYVGTAPEYAKCGFVGDFYEDAFLGGFCGDFHSSVSVSWPFMLAAAFCLFVSFVAFSCFVRKPQWYLTQDYDFYEERNNLTPGRTPRGQEALAYA